MLKGMGFKSLCDEHNSNGTALFVDGDTLRKESPLKQLQLLKWDIYS